MMKSFRASLCLFIIACAAACPGVTQTVTLQGLRLSNHRGSFKAAGFTPDGSLILLYDQGDGVRLLHTDAGATTLLAEVQVGSSGDTGVSMAQDPSGNVYVAGTSLSGSLTGTAGAVYPASADSSTNSFVAKFDVNLHLLFLSFLGSGRTAVTGVAATADAVFVTGTTYDGAFPTTAGSVQPSPAVGANGNGFVQRFSSDGASLVYSTFLTGTNGDTNPFAIAADAADNAYLAGETSTAAFPMARALRPTMSGSVSGFLTELLPAGDAFGFSTFVPGSGLTGLDIDTTTSTLVVSGGVDLGGFPVSAVGAPLTRQSYQSLLRVSEDGQELLQSLLLVPGTTSLVGAGPGGTAWVSGAIGTPGSDVPGIGNSFLLHVAADGAIDVLHRFGGSPVENAAHATLTGSVGSPAVSKDGTTAVLPATLSVSVAADLAPSQTFDIPLSASANPVLPGQASDLLPSTCSGYSQCSGSAGLLAVMSLGKPAASLSVSTGDLPNLTLRNEGSIAATGLAVSVAGYADTTNCGSTLLPGAQCGLVLSGAGPGSVQAASADGETLSEPLPSVSAPADPLVLDSSELDFGAATSGSSPVTRSITVTNLSPSPQSFSSAPDGVPGSPPYTLAETASSCSGAAPTHTVAGSSSCVLTFGLSASTAAVNDGPLRVAWKIGHRDVQVTGITQAAALSLSSAVLDFGTTFSGGHAPLPLYLYLSNLSTQAVPHAAVLLPGTLPFALTDGCPSTLEPESVCQLALTYTPAATPAVDSFTLELDGGMRVLLTGSRLLQPSAQGGNLGAAISVSPSSYTFTDTVPVTALSQTNGIISISNAGRTDVPFAAAITGDFRLGDGCGNTIPAGSSCALSILFAPSDLGQRHGLLSLTLGDGTAPVEVPLSGNGAPLLVSNNGVLQLGTTPVGEPTFAWFRITAPVAALTATVTGSAFRVALVEEDGYGHGTLPASAFSPVVSGPCADCWLGVAFVPRTAGPANGSLTLAGTAGGNAYHLVLGGTGLPLTGGVFTPAAPEFGTIPVGSSSAPLRIGLANLLSPAVLLSVQSVVASGDFKAVAGSPSVMPCSGNLASTASCSILLVFAPTATGPRTGTLTVTSDGGVFTLPLTGDGVADAGLALNPVSLNFTNVGAQGAALQQTLTLTNTGALNIAINTLGSSSASFIPSMRCGTLTPGASCTVAVQFTPGTSEASATLTIALSMTEANGQISKFTQAVPLTATYTGDEVGLVLLPAEADFGDAGTGGLGLTRQFTLLNTSAVMQTVTLSIPRQFPLATAASCGSLDAGASCTFAVTFLPETGGAITGSVLATATSAGGGSSQAIGYLQGYGSGSGVLTISDATIPGTPLNFGVVASGQTAHRIFRLTNAGAGPVTVRRMQSSPPFSIGTDCGSTLLPGSSCTTTLTYAPTLQLASATAILSPRTDTETLLIESDANSSPDEIDLSGTVTPVVASGSSDPAQLAMYTLSQGALTFVNTQVGNSSEPQVLTLLNTGNATLRFNGIQAPADFIENDTCSALAPTATCSITVRFTPGQNGGDGPRSGTLAIRSNATDALEFVSLIGLSSPAPLTLSPPALDFGQVLLGDKSSQLVTATNSAPLPIAFASLATTGDFSVLPGTCPAPGAPLAAGQSCTLEISFAPGATGGRSGILSVGTNATQAPLTVSFTGIGISPKLRASPGLLSFGSLKLGTSTSLTLNLVNSGTAILQNLFAVVTGDAASDFQIATPCPTNTYTPLSGCTMQIAFAPTAVGLRTATLVLSSSDLGGPLSIALSGSGTPASSFTLTSNGRSAATATVIPGGPASFPLTVTPKDGFTGTVALRCISVNAGPYLACSMPSASLDIPDRPASTTATLTTLGPVRVTSTSLWSLLALLPLVFRLRKRGGPSLFVLLLSVSALIPLSGCGGPGSSGRYITPPGTYRYVVTATSTADPTLTSSVTLSLVVR